MAALAGMRELAKFLVLYIWAAEAAGSCSHEKGAEVSGKGTQSLLQSTAVRWASTLGDSSEGVAEDNDDDELTQLLRQGPASSVAAADHLKSLESSLMALAGDGPSPEVMKTVEAMKSMVTEKMLPEIWSAHNATEATILALERSFMLCEESRATAGAEVAVLSESVSNFSAEQVSCRVEAGHIVAENTSAAADLERKKKSMEDKCARLRELEAGMNARFEESKPQPGEKYGDYVRRNQALFNRLVPEHEAAEAECANATAEHDAGVAIVEAKQAEIGAKLGECTTPQRQLESSGCQRLTKALDMCSNYDECHAAAKSSYETSRTAMEAAEAQRKAEYRATKRIECLLDAFVGNATAAKVDACKAETHSIGDLDIVYFDVVDKVACRTDFRAPCSADWVSQHYSAFPAGVEADPCVACIGAAAPTTTTTTTTTTTITLAPGKKWSHFNHGGSAFIYDESCEHYATACRAAGLTPSARYLGMIWDQAACDAIARGLGKDCSLKDFGDSASGLWCSKDTNQCGTHRWSHQLDNYGHNDKAPGYGCIYHCGAAVPPRVVEGARPDAVEVVIDPASTNERLGYGVEVPYSNGKCPNGEKPVGRNHYSAGATYEVVLEKDALVTVEVQFGHKTGPDLGYEMAGSNIRPGQTWLQWDQVYTEDRHGHILRADSFHSENTLLSSRSVSLAKGVHKLFIGSGYSVLFHTLPWCSINVTLHWEANSQHSNWDHPVSANGYGGIVSVRAEAWLQHADFYQINWPVVQLSGTNQDGSWSLFGGCGNSHGEDTCEAICRSLTNTGRRPGWDVTCGRERGYPSGAQSYASHCTYKNGPVDSGKHDWYDRVEGRPYPFGETANCLNPMPHCDCQGEMPHL